MTEQELKRAKVGDRVKFQPIADGDDGYSEGNITLITGRRYEVTWDDGEVYSYRTDPASQVKPLSQVSS